MKKKYLIEQYKEEVQHIWIFLKWLLLASAVGICIGLIATLFSYCLSSAQTLRYTHSWLIYCFPFGGLVIVLLYRFSGVRQSKGTNMVISSVRSTDDVPLKMAPLIFISTVLTHLFGGSAGREGAALQLGGSLAHQLGKLFKLDIKDMHIITMCGMSAAFSALFGTVITAAIFPMEVISVGIMYYAALVPCVVASIIASSIATALGVQKEAFIITEVPAFSFDIIWRVALLAILCAIAARIFCLILHTATEIFRMFIRNQYCRIFVGGCCIVILSMMFGSSYLGAGMDVIAASIEGHVIPEAFVLKMLFTSITLGCGFKGGEIVPSFFIGATLGALLGFLLGISPSFGAAIGLMSVFCGVTNCPITSLFLSFELFGFVGISYFLLADAIAYMLSGYESLYHEQKIMYSKFSPRFIDQDKNKP